MRIQIVNPNTTRAMTEKIGAAARAVAGAGTEIVAVNPAMGPVSIESHHDEALAVPGVLQEVARGEAEGIAGHVIACFGDPGLLAARELARGPVVGIAEAAMHAASFLTRRFSVVTTLARTIGTAHELAERYGMARFCAGIHACEIAVLDLERPGSNARERIVAACRDALGHDRSEAIVLGCAGMADLCEHVSRAIGVPVVDGVAAATLQVEALVRLGLRTSKRGELAAPLPKPITGLLAGFTLPAQPLARAA